MTPLEKLIKDGREFQSQGVYECDYEQMRTLASLNNQGLHMSLDALEELKGTLEGVDQHLCENIIDPCRYNPIHETKESLIATVEAYSEMNEDYLKLVRKALAWKAEK